MWYGLYLNRHRQRAHQALAACEGYRAALTRPTEAMCLALAETPEQARLLAELAEAARREAELLRQHGVE